jgi:dipeptide/tripeptide permease
LVFLIQNAASERLVKQKRITKSHWLDYAEDKYGQKLVADTKIVLKISKLFLTLPLYFAIAGQSFSRWVFQAKQMNGDLGFYTIKPDQMVISMTIFVVALIPIFDKFLYPTLARIGIKTPLQKIGIGYIFSALSFVLAAFIEWKIKDNFEHMLWLLPQYFVIAVADVFVWISAINFAYTQAPENMKSVITSLVYLTVAIGSLIVMIVSWTNIIKSQMYEFLMYSGLMVINTVCFGFISRNFKMQSV